MTATKDALTQAGADIAALEVILVEKQGVIGGSSALNAGCVYGAGTAVQKERGINDTTEQYYQDLLYLTEIAKDKYIDHSLLKMMAFNSPENIQWLLDHGVKFYTVDPAR